jgi:hypothetical protein
LADQVLEVRVRKGQVHLLRKDRIEEVEDQPVLTGPKDPVRKFCEDSDASHYGDFNSAPPARVTL